MNKIFKNLFFISIVFTILSSTAWGGWFSFEPNMKLLDGTPVSQELKDVEQQTTYLKRGDTAQADQLIKEERVIVIRDGRDMTRVKFLDFEESDGDVFVHVQDESGSKLWANISGLACVDQNGQERTVTKQDVIKGKFIPLPEN